MVTKKVPKPVPAAAYSPPPKGAAKAAPKEYGVSGQDVEEEVEEKPKTVPVKATITISETGAENDVTEDEVIGEVEAPPEPHALVVFGMGATRATKQYENVKFYVSVTLPCKVDADEIDETFTSAKDWVTDKVNELILTAPDYC